MSICHDHRGLSRSQMRSHGHTCSLSPFPSSTTRSPNAAPVPPVHLPSQLCKAPMPTTRFTGSPSADSDRTVTGDSSKSCQALPFPSRIGSCR
ncbi:hypothetical protein JB92DRAFT_2965372 [Gautieria morchelliformis]|nr:hypothetical protein JB92DRAFT_2965372 [Gautieria morchelliformis]